MYIYILSNLQFISQRAEVFEFVTQLDSSQCNESIGVCHCSSLEHCKNVDHIFSLLYYPVIEKKSFQYIFLNINHVYIYIERNKDNTERKQPL